MKNLKQDPQKANFIKYIKDLQLEYNQKELQGICFKLKEKNPLDVLGVLDFLKYKIKKWKNNNIFSYLGPLFNRDVVLVVGAPDIEEARAIIIRVYLKELIENKVELESPFIKKGSRFNIEQYLNSDVAENTKIGYPYNPFQELELKNHLDKLLNE